MISYADSCISQEPKTCSPSAAARSRRSWNASTGKPKPPTLRWRESSVGAIPVFEVSDEAESRTVLDSIGLGHASVIERADGDVHFSAVETRLTPLAAGSAQFVLTGKAPSIQRIGRALKSAGVTSARMKNKAYWAPGKTGLD